MQSNIDFANTPVVDAVNKIIVDSARAGASDIHFDHSDNYLKVRIRIDGILNDYVDIPNNIKNNVITRIKILSGMNITETRLPQDGAIKTTLEGLDLDMRVSALPLNEGEKIVIRILDYTRSLQGIDSLGFHPKNLEKIKRMMGIPNGIILTTGATGSGKSTTTYSILQGLNKPETNVITVEDPIEMNIEGINQVQVNAEIGMTFAAALRSILRQDPNVILIGEIRDSETAQIAVRASITGHLVLSTIHTNNALATVERLLDMDVERYLLSTALSGIISQRLAKMLCPDCRYQRETTKYEKKVFKKYMHMDVATVWDANPHGCDHCRRGYHGRIAVHEVLELTDAIRGAINNENLEKADLAKMVYDGGTITMLQDALIKCLEGKTSFEEVYRTIEIENEDDDNYESEMANEIKATIPAAIVETESDDLLDSTPKKNTENDISNVIQAPAFTAADFMSEEEKKAAGLLPPDNPEGEQKEGEKKEGEKKEGEQKASTKETAQPKSQNPAPAQAPATPAQPQATPVQVQPQAQAAPAVAKVAPIATVQPVQQVKPIEQATQTQPASQAQSTIATQPIVQTAAQNSMGTQSVQQIKPIAAVQPIKPINK